MEVNFHSYSDKSGIAWWEQCWWITTHINKVYQERSIALLSHKNQSLSDPCIYSTNYLIFCIILNTRHISKNFAPRSTCSQESVFKVSMCLALHKSKVKLECVYFVKDKSNTHVISPVYQQNLKKIHFRNKSM